MPESTRQWFSLFTNRTGVDDARTVTEHCLCLRAALLSHREAVLIGLAPGSGDSEPALIYGAWVYALDTMVQEASGAETCSWHVQGTDADETPNFGDGDVTLRRI